MSRNRLGAILRRDDVRIEAVIAGTLKALLTGGAALVSSAASSDISA